MTSHLVTFCDTSMTRAADLCVSSARQHGVDEASIYTKRDIESSSMSGETPFQVLALMDSNPRGAGGWWCWKPFAILEAMMMCGVNDYLIYSDAGIEFLVNVNYIIDRMDQDIFLFGNMWEHAHWCKRDIVEAIWPFPIVSDNFKDEATIPWMRFGKQVQASVIFFRVNDKTRAFVKEWLDWCLFEGGRLIDDSPSRMPNHPEFQENRHDQAILTTMAYRDGYKLHWWPALYRFDGGEFIYEKGNHTDDYPVLVWHHRRRNAEF